MDIYSDRSTDDESLIELSETTCLLYDTGYESDEFDTINYSVYYYLVYYLMISHGICMALFVLYLLCD
jgi:hypothetical protein